MGKQDKSAQAQYEEAVRRALENERKGKEIAKALEYVSERDLYTIIYMTVIAWMEKHGREPIHAADLFRHLEEVVYTRELHWKINKRREAGPKR